MKSGILKRIEIIEQKANLSRISKEDRLVIITYNDGDEHERDHLKQKCMVELREKYGSNISEDDFLIVWIRKFYQEEKKRCKS
jgi:hypothetical protein